MMKRSLVLQILPKPRSSGRCDGLQRADDLRPRGGRVGRCCRAGARAEQAERQRGDEVVTVRPIDNADQTAGKQREVVVVGRVAVAVVMRPPPLNVGDFRCRADDERRAWP